VPNRRDLTAIVVLTALVLAVFWRATLGGIFFFGDIFQLHYPLRSAYAQELRRLSLPLWTPYVMAGYPLLAEGQLGALYPPNLILHLLLPVPVALNVFILGHFLFAAVGAYAFARHLALRRTVAVFSGLVFALGGFFVAHLNHINIVACAAWMPWLFLLVDHLVVGDVPGRRVQHAALLGLGLGLEFLAGHAQIAVLTLVAVLAYALYLIWVTRPKLGVLFLLMLSLGLGVALAAAQLLPSYELMQLSGRSEGLDPDFFASFSLHPLYLISLLWPFVLGNPYPNASIELVAYVGILPLLLAVIAPFLAGPRMRAGARPVRRKWFFVALAFVAVMLALGRWNPIYMLFLRLPVLNLFRVPARYLYWFSFSAALLAGMGLNALFIRRPGMQDQPGAEDERGWLVIVGVALLVLLVVYQMPTADTLVSVWVWLPIVLGLLALGWVAWSWRCQRHLRSLQATLSLVLLTVDLIAFNAVFNLTYNQTMPLDEFTAAPRSLSFFRSQEGVYRLYTHEAIVPVLPVMRESYYPNLSIINGLASGNGSFPLVLSRYSSYVDQMTPRMLDLMGVRYFVIPQVLPVDEASEFYDLENPFALNPVGRAVPIPSLRVAELQVESYLSHSVDWPDGTPVARISLRGANGELETITLRAGWHTSEWAYERSDVSTAVSHRRAAVARSWPARSGFPPEDHVGHTYGASFRLEDLFAVSTVEVEPLVPQAFIRIERLVLIDQAGAAHLLSHLANKGDQTLVYRSEDAVVYHNHDAMPRAFLVHQAQAIPDDGAALDLLTRSDFDPRTTVVLAAQQTASIQPSATDLDRVQLVVYDSRRVVLDVQAQSDGYLVLTDTWYPGWRVRVDGQEASLLRADLVFRAVYLSAGSHRVQFEYAPEPFQLGCWISAAALLLLCGLLALGARMGTANLQPRSQ
jgi:hypothetical protein